VISGKGSGGLNPPKQFCWFIENRLPQIGAVSGNQVRKPNHPGKVIAAWRPPSRQTMRLI
jgi:hypothetical protein